MVFSIEKRLEVYNNGIGVLSIVATASLFAGIAMVTPVVVAQDNISMSMDNSSMSMDQMCNMTMSMDNSTDMGGNSR